MNTTHTNSSEATMKAVLDFIAGFEAGDYKFLKEFLKPCHMNEISEAINTFKPVA